LQPDLHPNDKTGIHRWNAPVATVVHSFSLIIRIFPHNSVALARLYPLHIDTSKLTMIRARPQYIAILHGKELHHE
jgi:hypothetical protein